MNNRTLALSFITSAFLACFYVIGDAINYPAFTFALLAITLFSFSTLSLLKKIGVQRKRNIVEHDLLLVKGTK